MDNSRSSDANSRTAINIARILRFIAAFTPPRHWTQSWAKWTQPTYTLRLEEPMQFTLPFMPASLPYTFPVWTLHALLHISLRVRKSQWTDFEHPWHACTHKNENCTASHRTVSNEMKFCSELTSIAPTDSEYSALVRLWPSQVDLIPGHKLNFLISATITPYLTSDVFTFLGGAWNSFNIPYTHPGKGYSFNIPYTKPGKGYSFNIPYTNPGKGYSFNIPYTNPGKGYSFKAELRFGYLMDKTKDTSDFIVPSARSCCPALCRFILRACYLRVNTIPHTSPADITDVRIDLQSFTQVRNSTHNDYLERDVAPSISLWKFPNYEYVQFEQAWLTSYMKEWRKKRRGGKGKRTYWHKRIPLCSPVPVFPASCQISAAYPHPFRVFIVGYCTCTSPSQFLHYTPFGPPFIQFTRMLAAITTWKPSKGICSFGWLI